MPPDKKNISGLRGAMRALRYRNYRLFFIGQGISLIGTWMQSVATSWLVYRLTQSEMMLGLVAFTTQIPAFIVSPFAGVLGDRMNRHRIIIIVQVLAMIQASILAIITITGIVQVWHIFILSFFLGLINSFEMPTRQAFVIEMVGDKLDLGNAIALNSGLFNGSRLFGPAIAGIMVAYAGEGVCFLANAVSFIAAIMAFSLMKIAVRAREEQNTRLLEKLNEGIHYVLGFTPIRDLLITVSVLSLVSMSFPVLLPVFAGSILKGGSHTYGFLVAATGLGALAGTIFLAMRKNVVGLGRVIRISLPLFGAGLVAFSFSQWMVLSTAILALIGFTMIATTASCNTIVQTIVDEDKRGRVMSFYVMAVVGTAPLGSLIAGSMSSGIGAPTTVRIGGLLCILAGLVFAWRLPSIRAIIRPIYQKMGIIPEVAMGMQITSEFQEPPE